VHALRDDEAGADAGDDQGEDPAEGGLTEHELVDALGALEERDAGGGANLAEGGSIHIYIHTFLCIYECIYIYVIASIYLYI